MQIQLQSSLLYFPSILRYSTSTESLGNLAMRELMHPNELANIVQISLQRSEKSLASYFLPGLILHTSENGQLSPLYVQSAESERVLLSVVLCMIAFCWSCIMSSFFLFSCLPPSSKIQFMCLATLFLSSLNHFSGRSLMFCIFLVPYIANVTRCERELKINVDF